MGIRIPPSILHPYPVQVPPWTCCQSVTGRHSHITTFTPLLHLEFQFQVSSMSLDCGRKPEHPNTRRTCKLRKEKPQLANGLRTVRPQQANHQAAVPQPTRGYSSSYFWRKRHWKLCTPSADGHQATLKISTRI